MERLFSNKKAALPLALAAMFFWGSLYPSVKLGYRLFQINASAYGDIVLFAGVRFVLCGLILVAFAGARAGRIRLPGRQSVKPILLIGLFGYALHYFCTYIGVSLIDSSKAAILKQTGSLFLICFAFLFRREDAFTPAKLIGGLLGFAGIIVINMDGLVWRPGTGDLLILAASFCSACATLLSKTAYDELDPLYITAWAQLFGGVLLTVSGLAAGGSIPHVDTGALMVFAYICFASCAGYTLWNMLLKYNDLSGLNIIKFAEPLFGSLCAALLLGEDIFQWPYVAALLLVLAGIAATYGLPRARRG